MPAYAMPGYYNNYNVQMMAMGMQNMQLGQPMYQAQNPYANYGAMYPQNGIRGPDSQSRVVAQRRQNDGEGKSPSGKRVNDLLQLTTLQQ
jgi:hypothetical protein